MRVRRWLSMTVGASMCAASLVIGCTDDALLGVASLDASGDSATPANDAGGSADTSTSTADASDASHPVPDAGESDADAGPTITSKPFALTGFVRIRENNIGA